MSFYKIGHRYKAKSPKYDAFLFDRVGDTRQNHWTMKYRLHEVTRSVKLNKYSKYDAYLLHRA